MPSRAEAPEAAVVTCPDCGEEQVHDVLAMSGSEATVRCRECSRIHRTVLKEARLKAIPVIISRGDASERGFIELPEDEPVAVEDELVAMEQQVQVRGIDHVNGKRVRKAMAGDIATLWAIHFETIMVKVAVNMGKRTISKSVPVAPRDSFTVGDEFDLDRLRIYIHAIRTPDGTIHRGTAEAKDIRRIFARPVELTAEERRERRAELGMPEPKVRRRRTMLPAPGPRAPRTPPKSVGGPRKGTRTPPSRERNVNARGSRGSRRPR